MTPVGLAPVSQLINREDLSPPTIYGLILRSPPHPIDQQGSGWSTHGKGPWGRGRQAWNGWGDDRSQHRWSLPSWCLIRSIHPACAPH
jgi:hypothetical protein